MDADFSLIERSRPFLDYLDTWYAGLAELSLAEVIGDAPEQVAVFSIDMVNGFCKEGALSGPRVGALIASVVALFQQAHDLGVRAFVLTQDTHDPETPEFAAYPPHCVAGTIESEAVDELKSLPFADTFTTVKKNSLSSFIGTDLDTWINERSLQTFVVIGDCTDLCVYTTAMHLRMYANAHNLQRRVVVPALAVDTFETPVSVAQELGIKAHPGDLHHVLFLHHMAMNGVEVVKRLH